MDRVASLNLVRVSVETHHRWHRHYEVSVRKATFGSDPDGVHRAGRRMLQILFTDASTPGHRALHLQVQA